jgi:L-seryl-tRNA(Ser) seleniumtransferase
VLNTFALGRTVPVSRGELIEIGGSFRLPDIMERSGCRLKEVGTTNRTHLKDFESAIDHDTGLLLKVHPSNYHVRGFTSTVPTADLAGLAHRCGLPLCVDLGSGSLVDLTRWGLPFEPMPQQLLGQGVDLVTFSGDKLLGAVQAGIILGRRELIDAMNRNPMKRALRPDKLTLAFLSRTLSLYEEPELLPQRLPLFRTLTTPLHELEQRASAVAAAIAPRLPDCHVEVAPGECQIGSGSLPDRTIPSVCVRISAASEHRVRELQTELRKLSVPVVGRVHQGALWLDMRGAEHLDDLCGSLSGLGA